MATLNLPAYARRLRDLRDRLEGEVEHILETVQEDTEAGGNLSHAPVHAADLANEGVDAEIDLLRNEQGILQAVHEALARIENGTFGRCQECGSSISEDRLHALPFTPHCVRCAASLE